MIEFGVLGPLRLQRDGSRVPIPTAKLRLLLGLLLASPGTPVSADAISDVLWQDTPPPTARRTLSAYVSRLRALLGDDDRVENHPGGYAIRPLPGELDSVEFERLTALAAAAADQGDLTGGAQALRDALALWRGPAFDGVRGDGGPSADRINSPAARLDELRLAVTERSVDLELELGHHGDVLPELTAMITDHPFRERPRAQLMVTLYRSGRSAEALEVYRQTVRLFADELGIGPSAELTDLHRRILAGDPQLAAPGPGRAGSAPNVLPRGVTGFIGRDAELDRLTAWIDAWEHASPVLVVSAIAGTGGVGKTALAVKWAGQIAHRFPDGVLFVNLHGYDQGEPMSALRAVSTLLRALGTAPEEIPADLDGAVALYRVALSGRRVLIVLDNASSVDQVRPLLPTSPECTVLITSRSRLTGLVAQDGAHRLDLDLLAPAASVSLLAFVIGERRAAREPTAIADLAELCGHLPLALRVAGGVLVDEPQRSIGDLVAQLRAEKRLDRLVIDDDPQSALRAVFDYSYRQLPPPAQRLFRGLAAIPGPDFEPMVASALAGGDATDSLRTLVDANLVTSTEPDRYAMHDLLREYAHELLESEGEAGPAVETVMRAYVSWTNAADQTLRPYRNITIKVEPAPEADLADTATALAWFDREGANLIAAVIRSADQAPELCWQLALTMHSWLDRRRRMNECIEIYTAAAAAARSLGNAEAEGWVLSSLGIGFIGIGRHLDALPIFEQLVEIARADGDLYVLGYRLGNLGSLLIELNRAGEAVVWLREAIATFHGIRDGELRRVVTMGNLALAHDFAGQQEEALSCYREALAEAMELGDDQTVAYIANNLSGLLRKRAEWAQARTYIELAAARSRAAGDLQTEVRTHLSLGEMALDLGDEAEARVQLAIAEKLYPDAPDDLTDDLRRRLGL